MGPKLRNNADDAERVGNGIIFTRQVALAVVAIFAAGILTASFLRAPAATSRQLTAHEAETKQLQQVSSAAHDHLNARIDSTNSAMRTSIDTLRTDIQAVQRSVCVLLAENNIPRIKECMGTPRAHL